MDRVQRNLAVSAFLDVTLGQWEALGLGMSDEDLKRLPPEIASTISVVISSLRNLDYPKSGGAYIQQIAMLCDDDLDTLVKLVNNQIPRWPDE